MSNECNGCTNGRCADHSAIEAQMKPLSELPNTVSKLTGIVSVIAGLFALLVGLAFNAHFEQLHQAENMISRFDTLGTHIDEMSDEHNKSKQRLSERLVRIETRIETAHRGPK